MGRRKKKSNSIVVYVLTAIIVVLITIIYLNGNIQENITKKVENTLYTGNVTTGNNINNKQYYANSTISGTGKVSLIPYDIKIGTKFKINYDNTNFFVKSDKYILDDYIEKNILFTGEVIGFAIDDSPVINIVDIEEEKIDVDTSEGTGENEDIKSKKYKLNDLLLNLENTDYQVDTGDNSLIIYKTGLNLSGEKQNKKLFNIESFKCEKGNYLYDCHSIKTQAKILKFKKITSNEGVIFYQLPETNQFVVLDDNDVYGYNFFPLSGDIYKIINYVVLQEQKKGQNKKEVKKEIDINEIIKNTCKNDKIQLVQVLKVNKDNNKYNVMGIDENSNKISCQLSINDGNTPIANLIDIKFNKKEIKTTDNTIVDDTIDESKYLVYKSRGFGFTLYMPKSSKYKSILIKNSLGVAGLTCVQQINIADRKTGDLKNPELKVLYCKTKVNKEKLEKLILNRYKNYKIIIKNGKTFIVLYKKTDIAKKMLDTLIIY